MTDRMTVRELADGFENGSIQRDDYWRRLQVRNRELLEYAALVRGRLARIEVAAEGLRITLVNGLTFSLNPDDPRTAPNLVVAHGDYEAEELRVMEALADGVEVVVDVGANIGWYSLHLARVVGPYGGRVVSFEPVAATFEALEYNCSLNPEAAWIDLHNVGLSDAEGTAQFSVPRDTGSVAASGRAILPDECNDVVQVRLARLDDFLSDISGGIGLMKCDIEGAELMALRGSRRLIAEHQPLLVVEMLRKWTAVYDYHPNDIVALLADLGYACWCIGASGLERVEEVTEETQATNFFFFVSGLHDEQRARVDGVLAGTVVR